MSQFKNKKDYEEWKKNREKDLQEDPERVKKAIQNSNDSKLVDTDEIKNDVDKTLRKVNELISQKRSSRENKIQKELIKQKSINALMPCPSCQYRISINADSCVKCGQPLNDYVRIAAVKRKITNRNTVLAIIAVPVALIFAFVLLAQILYSLGITSSTKSVKEKYELNTIRPATSSESATQKEISNTNSRSNYSRDDETRRELEQDERRRKLDALQPILREGCLQGNDDACRQYKKWEDMR